MWPETEDFETLLQNNNNNINVYIERVYGNLSPLILYLCIQI